MRPLYVDAAELRSALPVPAAVAALREAFASSEQLVSPLRGLCCNELGDLLSMPAMGGDAAGVKLVTVAANPEPGVPAVSGLYVLFGADLRPVAVIDGAELTAVRTSAVSALATDLLALPGASRLVVFGSGVQAAAHVRAMQAVRPIEEVVIVGRSGTRAAELAATLSRSGAAARAGSPGDVAAADIVCTCTTSRQPVLEGALLKEGAHVNAVGAYRPSDREIDDDAATRARLVVEERPAALAEAGDIVIPLEKGLIAPASIVADLHELVTGAPARRNREEITLFKSVGLALEDLAVARAAVARLAAAGALP